MIRRTYMKNIIGALFLITFSNFASAALMGVEDDLDNFVRIFGYESSYDSTSLSYTYDGTPEFVRIDGACCTGISGGSVNLDATIDNDGNLLGGTFEVTGGVAGLGIADDSVLFSGTTIQHSIGYFGDPSIIKHEFLVELDSTLLPSFTTGYVSVENLYVTNAFSGQPALDLDNLFTLDWGPRGAPTFNHFQQATYNPVAEPNLFILFFVGLILLFIAKRNSIMPTAGRKVILQPSA